MIIVPEVKVVVATNATYPPPSVQTSYTRPPSETFEATLLPPGTWL